MGVFEVYRGTLHFTYRLEMIRTNKYKFAGEIIRWSLSHGGPGVHGLSPAVYSLMVGDLFGSYTMTEEDILAIPDSIARTNLLKVGIAFHQIFRNIF